MLFNNAGKICLIIITVCRTQSFLKIGNTILAPYATYHTNYLTFSVKQKRMKGLTFSAFLAHRFQFISWSCSLKHTDKLSNSFLGCSHSSHYISMKVTAENRNKLLSMETCGPIRCALCLHSLATLDNV